PNYYASLAFLPEGSGDSAAVLRRNLLVQRLNPYLFVIGCRSTKALHQGLRDAVLRWTVDLCDKNRKLIRSVSGERQNYGDRHKSASRKDGGKRLTAMSPKPFSESRGFAIRRYDHKTPGPKSLVAFALNFFRLTVQFLQLARQERE